MSMFVYCDVLMKIFFVRFNSTEVQKKKCSLKKQMWGNKDDYFLHLSSCRCLRHVQSVQIELVVYHKILLTLKRKATVCPNADLSTGMPRTWFGLPCMSVD